MKIIMSGALATPWADLREQLQRLNHEVVGVVTFNQIIRLLASEKNIDAVLLDVSISDECGLKLLRSPRTDRRLAQIPIILAGASFSPENVFRYHEFEVFDLIVLPVDYATLEAKILRVQREGKKTILIVDDEEAIADVLSDHLEMERYRTVTASSGEQALEILKSQTVHAVVTDIMMPGMSGLDLLAEVKSSWPGVPVVMITGYAGNFSPSDVMASGADGYFSKPFKNIELSYTLGTVLSKYGTCVRKISPNHVEIGAEKTVSSE